MNCTKLGLKFLEIISLFKASTHQNVDHKSYRQKLGKINLKFSRLHFFFFFLRQKTMTCDIKRSSGFPTDQIY